MLDDLVAAMRYAIYQAERWPDREVLLLHHNDSDGLASAAVLTRTFERAGFDVDRACLEKPYPVVLERIFERDGGLIVLTDFAGRIAPLVSDLNRGRNLVLILDHHKAEPATDDRVHLLDPEVFGLRGDRDITASVTCLVFARTWDSGNSDLGSLAVIGAVGDRFFVDGRLVGVNRDLALQLQAAGLLEIEDLQDGERYVLITSDGRVPVDELARDLDTLGGAGYSAGGPETAIDGLLRGPSEAGRSMLARLQAVQHEAFAEEFQRVRSGEMASSPHVQWLHVRDRFAPMGVKMIGAFLDELKNTDVVDSERYLAGFQPIPPEVPGIGSFRFGQVKVSMRVSEAMAEGIRSGRVLGLDVLLPAATARVGGFSDACHSLTAATTVPEGSEGRLIDEIERVLGEVG